MGAKIEKKIFTITVNNDFIDELDGRVDNVIEVLQNIKETYGEVYEQFGRTKEFVSQVQACEWFSLDYSPSYYGSEESSSIKLLGHRYESDEDFNKRKLERNTANAKRRANKVKKEKLTDGC